MSGRESTTEIPEKPDRKPKVKWPKASDKEAWGSFDESLYTTLEQPKRQYNGQTKQLRSYHQ